MATKKAKHRYIEGLGIIIIVLALVRCACEADWSFKKPPEKAVAVEESPVALEESPVVLEEKQEVLEEKQEVVEEMPVAIHYPKTLTRYVPDGGKYHRILSVSSYRESFPDSNDVQLAAAQQWGVTPVRDRADAELRKDELVYMAASPYYAVAPLASSIPYLVPRAAVLLNDIGQAFFDSLQVKGLPLHHFIVSSVLRSEEDVRRLRRVNRNATEQSCHLYGTTFDINYNRYQSVAHPDRELVGSDRLKWVLSEVLDDMRQQGRCYIKYEVKQPCFHITVR